MSYPAVNHIVRWLRVAPVISLMFMGCTCSEEPAVVPASAATPAAIVQPQQRPTVAEATQSAPQPAAATPMPAPPTPEAVPTVQSDARRADCERYVAALSGKNPGQALLKDPAFAALAPRASDLLTCLAVKGDSGALCDLLIETQPSGERRYTSQARDCLYAQSIFHEVRAHPKGTSFTFADIELQQCDDRKACDALREATRTGDVKKCDQLGAFQSICRAFVKLDKSLCHIDGKLPKESYSKSAVEEGCRMTIDTRAYLARGLQTVADSGSGKERTLARAALGQADACKEYEQAAVDACLAAVPASSGTPAGAAPTPAGEQAPTAPQGTPQGSPPTGEQPGSAPA